MRNNFTCLLLLIAICQTGWSQVKSSYLYNTSMPYGTLDIRTNISSTNYFYLQENTTFSFRQSSPGVKTNTFLDMTTWDTSPYKQGNLRQKNGTKDLFVMNYRFLPPVNYQTSYAEGYPLVIILHGANERGNCWFEKCYHATSAYSPVTNTPPAPTTATHKLLNNDHNLNIGGKQHMDARNLAGTRLPNDPSMPARAFPGFVLVPQTLNGSDSLNVQDVIRLTQLLMKKYKIDPNRVYIHGLSIGGYGTYEALKRASWLFAAALPMSAVRDASMFKQNQQAKVAPVPLWIFQGGLDTDPSPAFTNKVVDNLKKAGAVVRYTVYSDLGHTCWNRAYGEREFFTWMLSKNKANITPFAGNTVIIKSKNQYPTLMLSEGFLAYQWEKNGVIISGATTNKYKATTPGTYRARFSRLSSVPSATQWNKWSAPVTVTESLTSTTMASTDSVQEVSLEGESFGLVVFPNPSSAQEISVRVNSKISSPVQIKLMDNAGKSVHDVILNANEINQDMRLRINQALPSGVYIVSAKQGRREVIQKVVLKE